MASQYKLTDLGNVGIYTQNAGGAYRRHLASNSTRRLYEIFREEVPCEKVHVALRKDFNPEAESNPCNISNNQSLIGSLLLIGMCTLRYIDCTQCVDKVSIEASFQSLESSTSSVEMLV